MRTFLKQSGLPPERWNHGRQAAAFTMDRVPRRSGKTPYKLYYLQPPDLSHLRIFGSNCFYHVHNLDRHDGPGKLGDTSNPGLFLGYDEHRRALKVLPRGGRLPVFSCSVIFDERGVLQRALHTAQSGHISSDDNDHLLVQSHAVYQQAQSKASDTSHSSSVTPSRENPSSATKRSVLKSAKSSHSSPVSSAEQQSKRSKPNTRYQRKLNLTVQDGVDSVNITMDCPAGHLFYFSFRLSDLQQ